MRRCLSALSFSFSVFLILIAPAAAQEARHTLSGSVTAEHSRKPLVSALVELIERRLLTRTNASGEFTFKDLPAGTYHVRISHDDYAEVVKAVTVPGETPAISMDLEFHEPPVQVTASPTPEETLKVYRPAGALGGHELEQKAGASLGATLQAEPGISTTSFGTAPARPVIRGLGGDRVLILEDGLRTGDVSSQSPDHAVAVNPEEAENIEIVRGAANLLYGSNATGGVINVINGEIPSRLLDRPGGEVALSGSSNIDELSGRASLAGSIGKVALKAGWSRSDAGEFQFRGGAAGNSQYDFTSYHTGLSYVGSGGFVGAAYRRYEGNWGIPVDDAGGLVSEGDPGVTLAMEQDSFKLTGQITRPFGIFTGGRLQASQRDYTHTEFEETGEPGTTFNLDTLEARAEVTHKEAARLKGSWGAWLVRGDFEAIGDEAIVPRADTRGHALFFYEELGFKWISVLFGGRWDDHHVDRGSSVDERDFSALSGALGAIVNPGGAWSIAANLTRNFKAPSPEELFASGPHIATFAFEVGDPDLEEETSIGADLSFRWNTKRFKGEVTGFRTDFQDFIFLQPDPNGATDPGSGLPIANYLQADALFQGLEAHADVSLLKHLTLEIVGDTVRATNEETDGPLPRIPPYRVGLGINWDTDRYGLGAEARHAGPQDRIVAAVEEPTDGYTLYNAFIHVQFSTGRTVHRFSLRGENLTNVLYRNHVSLVKEIVPQSGRLAKLAYSMLF